MKDFTVTGGPSVFLLIPNTPEAEAWVDLYIPEDATYLGKGVAVEHRYISEIVKGVQADGLTMERAY